ncbi:hypothetical protein NDU88_002220 [Pleurodeles waltl]|uniref:Uncharacterized protein n=1 Tax=Pleurodeles waltl TaxID=8319 RepID=A0AAV7LBY9_PLEWA|nr:hypothetical protein NDU88_002220 [Pleurodeles waltl]
MQLLSCRSGLLAARSHPLILAFEPRSGTWLWFRHQLQRLASSVRHLRQPQGKLESQRTCDHDPSAGAGSLLPRGPISVSLSWTSGLSTGLGSRQQLQASGVRRLGSRGKSRQIRVDLSHQRRPLS